MHQPSLLSDLGQRIRATREQRRLPVGELARRAGVSRRYLTETESGRANPSYLVLVRLAEALGVDLAELFAPRPRGRAPERIALVGLRGAGKSTVGRMVALELEVPFRELDREVERLAGMSAGQIFELHGAAAFHRLEGEALEQVLASGERAVIEVGGSIVESQGTYERLLATCRCVWLRAPAEDHFARVLGQGDDRPMRNRPRALLELTQLLEQRRAAYGRAEISVDTAGLEPKEVAARVLTELGLRAQPRN